MYQVIMLYTLNLTYFVLIMSQLSRKKRKLLPRKKGKMEGGREGKDGKKEGKRKDFNGLKPTAHNKQSYT